MRDATPQELVLLVKKHVVPQQQHVPDAGVCQVGQAARLPYQRQHPASVVYSYVLAILKNIDMLLYLAELLFRAACSDRLPVVYGQKHL